MPFSSLMVLVCLKQGSLMFFFPQWFASLLFFAIIIQNKIGLSHCIRCYTWIIALFMFSWAVSSNLLIFLPRTHTADS